METCSICYEEKKIIQTKCNHFFVEHVFIDGRKKIKNVHFVVCTFILECRKRFRIIFKRKSVIKTISTTVYHRIFCFLLYRDLWETFSSIQYIFIFIEENDKKI